MQYKNIELEWLGHSGFKIKSSDLDRIIYIDPFKISEENEGADIIFITHSHQDHCSIEDLRKIVKPNTIIICSHDCQSKISRINQMLDIKLVEPTDKMEFFEGKLKFWVVQAYNISKEFHTKEDYWNGYVLQLGDIKVYHAGDTDLIPEMKNLSSAGIDIALLPMGGGFTMNAGEAAKAASIIKPKIAIPMHYASISGVADRSEANLFQKYCLQEGVEVKILEQYNLKF